MSSNQGTPLDDIPGWTRDLIDRLNEGWITAAEQVVELAATAQGMAALAEHLEIPEWHARALVDAACARLDVDAVAASTRRTRGDLHSPAGEES
jgi:hypothetical protein